MSKFNAVISFDETKPHWAQQQGLDKEAERLGMTNIYVSGDFDAKTALIYGNVENFESFKAAAEANKLLREGSVYRVAGE